MHLREQWTGMIRFGACALQQSERASMKSGCIPAWCAPVCEGYGRDHGVAAGSLWLSSISRNMRATNNPSRIQFSACHHS